MTKGIGNSEDNGQEKNFEELLLDYERKGGDDVQVGDRVIAEIVSIGRESVFVDIGAMMDGVVDRDELAGDDGQITCSVGDRVELYVVSVSDREVRLSRALSGVGGLRALRDAFEKELPVEGKVIARCKGGYEVRLMHHRAFCPASQIDLRYAENKEQYIGKTYRFILTRFEERGRNIVVSRRKLLEEESAQAKKEFLGQLKEGEVLDGKVTRVAQFGAFVEIFPGLEGMVHISELSWSHVTAPEEVVKVSDIVKVRVLGVIREEKTENARISLSIKEAVPDPWESLDARYEVGQIVAGKVMRCAPFGAFVQLEPGVEGLVHISEMSYTRRVLKSEEVVSSGDTVKVMIKDIDRENRRISLSIKDVEGDPWAEVFDRYSEGQVVKARIERKEPYGYFASIEPGLTGLIPQSLLDGSPERTKLEKCKVGDIISVVIRQINQPQRRITLEPGPGAEDAEWKSYRGQRASFGSLADKLREAMRGKGKDK